MKVGKEIVEPFILVTEDVLFFYVSVGLFAGLCKKYQ